VSDKIAKHINELVHLLVSEQVYFKIHGQQNMKMSEIVFNFKMRGLFQCIEHCYVLGGCIYNQQNL
jgi:hypothetical protein